MAYYTEEQLKELGFKYIGKNVKISDKELITFVEELASMIESNFALAGAKVVVTG